MNKLLVLIISFVIICLGAVSCAPKHDYFSDFHSINPEGWDARAPEVFAIDDTVGLRGNLMLTVRHDAFYPYRNIWLFVNFEKNDSVIECDTIDCPLADINGRWLGKGFGSSYEKSLIIKEKCVLNSFDRIVISSGLRDLRITGITDIGISLIPEK